MDSPPSVSASDEKRGQGQLTEAQQGAHEAAPRRTVQSASGPPPFRWASLWQKPVLNPLNLKSYTVPIFNLANPYARNLHLAWLGFFVAFLSWFAFPPLFPEAIKADLKLTTAQVGNSNIIALLATLVVRFAVGPAVDRFGPRKVMAGILVAGAIPSGLAGTASSAGGLYAVRFFIGILGGTFVPCVAWTTAFFDKSVVGTVNAFAAGWGNAGGGATYAIMVSLYSTLHKRMSQHNAWRVAFAIVPVPVLLLVAAATLVFGTDHPAGKWSQRHLAGQATAAAVMDGHEVHMDHAEIARMQAKKAEPEGQTQTVHEVNPDEDDIVEPPTTKATVTGGKNDSRVVTLDVAVNEALTWKAFAQICLNPLTWLPALAYMTTFGFELAVDSNLATVMINANPGLNQIKAGYYASVFGLLNVWTRPLGGIFADMLYARFGVRAKKYFTLCLGLGQGAVCLGFGILLQRNKVVDIGHMMGLIVVLAHFNEFANGANFSLVPHCNSYNNGVMSGIVGAFGNLGGIWFALIFRYKPHQGTAWVYCGVLALIVNFCLLFIRSPKQ